MTTTPSNIHIVVYPDLPSTSPEDLAAKYQLVADRIQQFLSGKNIPAVIYVDYDEQEVCSYCGQPRSAENEEEDGYPLCCKKAQEEWERTRSQSSH